MIVLLDEDWLARVGGKPELLLKEAVRISERQMRIHRIGGILPPDCGKMPQIQRVYSHLLLAVQAKSNRIVVDRRVPCQAVGTVNCELRPAFCLSPG
jgi:hypothetical protein